MATWHIDIQNISLVSPMEVIAHAAVFSYEQNIHLKGRFKLPSRKRPAQIKSIQVNSDLRLIEMPALVKAVPELKGVFVPDRQAGELMIEMGALDLDETVMEQLTALIRLKNGRIVLTEVPSAIDQINAEMLVESDRIKIRSFGAQFAEGIISGKAEIDHWLSLAQITFDIAIETLELNQLQPETKTGEPEVYGKLSADFHGVTRGQDGDQILQNLSGQGKVSVLQGRIANLNITQEVFRNLSIIPGLVDRLKQRLPKHYEEKLAAEDTDFEFVNVPIVASKGVLYVNNFFMTSDTFQILGTGWYAFNGQVEGQSILRFDADLTDAFIRSVQELQYLTNANGQLEIPIRIYGMTPDVKVLPDVQFVASKLAISKTRDILGELLSKKMGKEEPPTTDPRTSAAPESQAGQEPSSGGLFGQLLQSALDEWGSPKETS